MRTAATFGLAITGPVAFFSGIAVIATIVAGPPRWLLGLFVIAVAITIGSIALFLIEDVRRHEDAKDH